MGTIPTIAAFAASGIVTSTYLNTIKAASDFWALTPRCYTYQATAQTLTTSTWTTINLDAEVYDIVQSGDSPSHDNITNNSRVVVRTTGKYEISGQVATVFNATGYRMARIQSNSLGILVESHQGAVPTVSTSVPLPPIDVALTAGDYLYIEGYQTSGGNLNTLGGQSNTFLRMKLTGA